MKKLLLSIAMLVLATPVAHAGFMIEPYVGYEMGSVSQAGSPDYDYTGTVLGARLGYGMLGFSFGIDYGMGDGTVEETTPPDTDLSIKDMGLFVAYEFPIMLRVYATYIMDSSADADDGTGAVELTGKGTKIGIGWTGLPFVAINLEMTTRTFDEAAGIALGANEIELGTTALVVSLPLP